MIFPYNPPQTVSFWMRNTVLSLDIIFIGVDGRVVNIAANATPYSEQSLARGGAGLGRARAQRRAREGAGHRRGQQGRVVSAAQLASQGALRLTRGPWDS